MDYESVLPVLSQAMRQIYLHVGGKRYAGEYARITEWRAADRSVGGSLVIGYR